MPRLILALVFASINATVVAQGLNFINIGSGGLGGGYFSTAKALCASINTADTRKIRCSPEPTNGSIYNLKMLDEGELDFAFVQSDWQLAAYNGTGIFSGNPMAELRSVMSLYPEVITIIVGRDSGIFRPQDLLNKRIDIGPPSSGRHATAKTILSGMGLNTDAFGAYYELTTTQAISGLCDGTIDASFFVLGHPSRSVAQALSQCSARIIELTDPAFSTIFSNSQSFIRVKIPSLTYPELEDDVNSYAVYATIVTRSDVSDDVVDIIVKSTIMNLDLLRSRVSQLRDLNFQDMTKLGLSAPLHTAAKLAFEESAKPTQNQ